MIPVIADLDTEFELPGRAGPLDGMLFANTLHFIQDAAAVVARLTAWLRPGGRAVIVRVSAPMAGRPVSAGLKWQPM